MVAVQGEDDYSNAGLNTAQQVPEDAEALSFSNNAPSWEELSELVAKRSAELQWSPPDVESVSNHPSLPALHLAGMQPSRPVAHRQPVAAVRVGHITVSSINMIL